MNKINITESKVFNDFLLKQIAKNQKDVDLFIQENEEFSKLESKARNLKGKSYTLIYYSHTYEIALFHGVSKAYITDFTIKSNCELEIFSEEKEVIDFAKEVHEILKKEFY